MSGRHALLPLHLEPVEMAGAAIEVAAFRKLSEARNRPLPTGVSPFRDRLADILRAGPAVPLQGFALSRMPAPPDPAVAWESLAPLSFDAEGLEGKGLFPNASGHPDTVSFDILRTRILSVMQDRGWRRVAISAPTHGCGTSFLSVNLALSMARRYGGRTILIDAHLRCPGLAALFGQVDAPALRDVLMGARPFASQLRRVGATLALGLNGSPVPDAAELLQSAEAARALAAMTAQFDPQTVVFDLPPMLAGDDAIGFLPQVDAVVLVIDATRTTAADITSCTRLLEGRTPLLGAVLNRARDHRPMRHRAGRRQH